MRVRCNSGQVILRVLEVDDGRQGRGACCEALGARPTALGTAATPRPAARWPWERLATAAGRAPAAARASVALHGGLCRHATGAAHAPYHLGACTRAINQAARGAGGKAGAGSWRMAAQKAVGSMEGARTGESSGAHGAAGARRPASTHAAAIAGPGLCVSRMCCTPTNACRAVAWQTGEWQSAWGAAGGTRRQRPPRGCRHGWWLQALHVCRCRLGCRRCWGLGSCWVGNGMLIAPCCWMRRGAGAGEWSSGLGGAGEV